MVRLDWTCLRHCSCWGNIEGNLDTVYITTQRYNLLQSFLFNNNLYLPIKTVIIIAYRETQKRYDKKIKKKYLFSNKRRDRN